MPELITERTVYSLNEVARSIKTSLSSTFPEAIWIKAEMVKLKQWSSGHCYPELVEKKDGVVIAKLGGFIWESDYSAINNKFLDVLKEPLKDGIKILFCGKPEFHPVRGLSINIIDIDPSFTLGDLEAEKQKTIHQLEEEGIFNQNKSLKIPLVPQRIALITAPGAAGHLDFIGPLENNSHGFKFFFQLFSTPVSGDPAIHGIINSLNQIKNMKHRFDIVALVRAGGDDSGFSCYNNYNLSKTIATFPIPVITGIGHSTNLTVAEMVSHTSKVAPSDCANFLLSVTSDFANKLSGLQNIVINKTRSLLLSGNQELNSTIRIFRSSASKVISSQKGRLALLKQNLTINSKSHIRQYNLQLASAQKQLSQGIPTFFKMRHVPLNGETSKLSQGTSSFFRTIKNNLFILEKNIMNMHPANVLKRGFSITYHNGRALKSTDQLSSGDILTTKLYSGSLTSKINSITKTDKS